MAKRERQSQCNNPRPRVFDDSTSLDPSVICISLPASSLFIRPYLVLPLTNSFTFTTPHIPHQHVSHYTHVSARSHNSEYLFSFLVFAFCDFTGVVGNS